MAIISIAEILEKPLHEYWLTLGQFVYRFADVERDLHSLLRHLSGVSKETAPAIFYGVRIDAAKDSINRILDSRGDSETKNRLEKPFKQLGEIASARNNILHWGSRPLDNNTYLVTNDYLAHTKERLREMRVTPQTIREMTEDLWKIQVHIMDEIPDSGPDELAGVRQKFYAPILAAAWRYKSAQQSPPPKTNPGKERGRRRRRPSSPK